MRSHFSSFFYITVHYLSQAHNAIFQVGYTTKEQHRVNLGIKEIRRTDIPELLFRKYGINLYNDNVHYEQMDAIGLPPLSSKSKRRYVSRPRKPKTNTSEPTSGIPTEGNIPHNKLIANKVPVAKVHLCYKRSKKKLKKA